MEAGAGCPKTDPPVPVGVGCPKTEPPAGCPNADVDPPEVVWPKADPEPDAACPKADPVFVAGAPAPNADDLLAKDANPPPEPAAAGAVVVAPKADGFPKPVCPNAEVGCDVCPKADDAPPGAGWPKAEGVLPAAGCPKAEVAPGAAVWPKDGWPNADCPKADGLAAALANAEGCAVCPKAEPAAGCDGCPKTEEGCCVV